jgi:hypothetical protein
VTLGIRLTLPSANFEGKINKIMAKRFTHKIFQIKRGLAGGWDDRLTRELENLMNDGYSIKAVTEDRGGMGAMIHLVWLEKEMT